MNSGLLSPAFLFLPYVVYLRGQDITVLGDADSSSTNLGSYLPPAALAHPEGDNTIKGTQFVALISTG